ncbi:hypothetical protein CBW56_06415 [Denitratisoma oestradiolicum]|nr:hypothetical protein CBW56_06415 [Denitratisoma oestradiolicum]
MIYGANGYTGSMVAEEACRRGLRPLLGGRDAHRLAPLAQKLGLETRIFNLDSPAQCQQALAGVNAVAHCAGPFVSTAVPMARACLEAGAHYLDISGELPAIEAVARLENEARRKNVVLCPSVGWDVLPTDCFAAQLARALPDAEEFSLALHSTMAVSSGTAKSSLGLLAQPTLLRRDGRLQPVARRRHLRQIDFGRNLNLLCAPATWGDLASAGRSTGIANISVYLPLGGGRLEAWAEPLIRALLGREWVRRKLSRLIERNLPGPDAQALAHTTVHVWGEVKNRRGEGRIGRMTTGNPYLITMHGVLATIEHLDRYAGPGGYFTPSQLLGADVITRIPGCGPIVIEPARSERASHQESR